MLKRYCIFLIGLTFMALGIVLIIKSVLGTSPISSLPYILSLALPLTVGEFNFVVSFIMFLLQPVILGRKFEWIQLLQVPMTFIFCAFIDCFMYLFSWLEPTLYYEHLIVLFFGCLSMGIGVTCELLGKVVMLPGEGLVNAIATNWNFDFGKTKIVFDWSLVSMAALCSLYFFGEVEGIREGTLISAFSTGFLVRCFMYLLGLLKHRRSAEAEKEIRFN